MMVEYEGKTYVVVESCPDAFEKEFGGEGYMLGFWVPAESCAPIEPNTQEEPHG